MDKDLISIIIPVYNVEKYLNKCLDSIINQTYKKLEIILVDDGSTDNSPKICNEYAKIDKRIKVIHKKNRGVSSARNRGLNNINGSYVLFVDSDDYLELNMIEILYKNSKTYNADISICNYYSIDNDTKTKGSFLELENKNLSNEEFYNYLYLNTYYCGYLWNKLFKREIISNHLFDENIHILEDLLFVSEVSENANNIYYDYDEYLYNYVKRDGSVLGSKFNYKKISSIVAREKILKYALKYNSKGIEVLKFYLLWESIYYKYKLKNKNGYYIDYQKYRKYFYESISCREIPLLKRIKLIIIYFIPNTYFTFKEEKLKYKR